MKSNFSFPLTFSTPLVTGESRRFYAWQPCSPAEEGIGTILTFVNYIRSRYAHILA
jgi:hypothetical protein